MTSMNDFVYILAHTDGDPTPLVRAIRSPEDLDLAGPGWVTALQLFSQAYPEDQWTRLLLYYEDLESQEQLALRKFRFQDLPAPALDDARWLIAMLED